MAAPIDPLIPTPAEQKLIDAAAAGQVCTFEIDGLPADPSESDAWGTARTIRAVLLATLLTGERADWPVHRKGVRVRGAAIYGDLDLAFNGVKLYTNPEAKALLSGDFTAKTLGAVLKAAKDAGIITKDVDPASMINPSFINATS